MTQPFYALIGNPVSHSLSPHIYKMFAEQLQCSFSYRTELTPIGHFSQTLDALRQAGLSGANITVPFKQEAFAYADYTDEAAQKVKAASAIKFNTDGTSLAVNFDGYALVRDITQNLKWKIRAKHLLILGAGGAARGILFPLLQQQPARIVLVNRTRDKAEEIAKTITTHEVPVHACDYHSLPHQSFDIIINATSASLKSELPPLPSFVANAATRCYDLAYSDAPTIFLQWAHQQGCQKFCDGIGMLVEHNAECFNLWLGLRPHTTSIILSLKHSMLK